MNRRFVRRAERAALRASLLDITWLSIFSYALMPVHPALSATCVVLSISVVWKLHAKRMARIAMRCGN